MVWSKSQPPAAQSVAEMRTRTGTPSGTAPTHGIHNLDQEPRATGQIATIFVITLIAQRVKELRNQIAMRGMNLNRLEAGGHRTARRHGERADQTMNLIHGQRARRTQPTERDFRQVPW